MSLSSNQNLTLESDTTSDHRQDTSGRTTSKRFEMQAALIPDENRFEYESAAKLLSIVKSIANSGSAKEYFLYFHGVTHDHLPEIDRAFFESEIRCTILSTTENSLRALICRILPGGRHKTLMMNLLMEIGFKVSRIPGHNFKSINRFTARRFYLGDIRSKEGYQDLGPEEPMAKGVWPPAVVEVGYSDALEFLRLDAEWWLINSASATRLVILVQLMVDPFAIRIEFWVMALILPSTRIGDTPIALPRRVQLFNIDANGVVTSTSPEPELRIPYSSLFDEPNENAQDVVFTNDELSSFALRMFRLMNR